MKRRTEKEVRASPFNLAKWRRNMEDHARRYPMRPGYMLCLDGTYEKVPEYQPRPRTSFAWPAWARVLTGRELPQATKDLVAKLLAEFLEGR